MYDVTGPPIFGGPRNEASLVSRSQLPAIYIEARMHAGHAMPPHLACQCTST